MSQGSNKNKRKRHREKNNSALEGNQRSSSTSPPLKMAAVTGSSQKMDEIIEKNSEKGKSLSVLEGDRSDKQCVKLDKQSGTPQQSDIPSMSDAVKPIMSDASQPNLSQLNLSPQPPAELLDNSQNSGASNDTGIDSNDSILTVIDQSDSRGEGNQDGSSGGSSDDSDSDSEEEEDNFEHSQRELGSVRRNRSNSMPDTLLNGQLGDWYSGRITRSQSSAKDNYIVQAITREILDLKQHMMREMSKKTKTLSGKIAGLEKKMFALNTEQGLKIGKVEASVELLEKGQKELDTKIESKIKAVNCRFETQQQAITKVKNSVIEWNNKQKTLDDTVKTVKGEYGKINGKLNQNITEIGKLSGNLEQYKVAQNELKKEQDERIKKTEGRVEKHKKEILTVQDDVSALKRKVHGLETGKIVRQNNTEDTEMVVEEGETQKNAQSVSNLYKEDLETEKKKVKELESRLAEMEAKLNANLPAPCDDVPKCLIAYNVHYQEEENLLEKCTRLIAFIHPQALPVLDCKRIGNGTVENPPMCKIALSDVGKKVSVLQHRQCIKECPEFSNVTLRPSRDHLERQMRKNFATLSRNVPGLNNRFRMTSHSLLVERNGSEDYSESDSRESSQDRGRGSRGRNGRRGRGSSRVRGARGSYGRGRGGVRGRGRGDINNREYHYSDSDYPSLNNNSTSGEHSNEY